MDSFINYLLEVNVALVIFIALYALLLQNEKNFSWKRKLIVASVLVAISAPIIKTFAAVILPSSSLFPALMLPEISMTQPNLQPAESIGTSPWTIALALYFIAVAIAALRLIVQVSRLFRYAVKWKKQRTGKYDIVEIPGVFSFSFFHTIFIGNTGELSAEDRELILQHEMAHAEKFHSIDRLLFEVVQIFCWFNPLLIYYKKELTAVHEFECDEKIIQQTDIKKYCNLLARVALMSADFNIANHFYNSLTSKRITMMKTESKKISAWKLGLIIPLMACVVVIVACQEQAHTQHNNFAKETSNDDSVYEKVDNMPEFPGGMSAMATFIGENVKYPTAAREKKIEGKVFVYFVVNKDGSLTGTKVLKGVDPQIDAEALRVVKLMPKLTPGTLKGTPVRSSFVLPIRFSLD